MSEVKVNKITPTADCGTVTLGDSGDTIAIPAGTTVTAPSANVTNSGTVNSTTITNSGTLTNSGTITNTGTISGGTISGNIDGQVSWQTTVKTSGFTATAGEGYFCNTTSAAFTVTLPASPSAGDIVGIKDYANTADTNNITIGRNGSNIQGTANDFVIDTEGLAIILLYVDATKGWLSVGQSKASDISEQQLYVTATGGTVTTCGDYKIHTFTSPGTFCVSCAGNSAGNNKLDYLVVAGGGSAGGAGNPATYASGGGGAGGYRESKAPGAPWTASPLATCASLTASPGPSPVTVGGGGAAATQPGKNGGKGNNSVFMTITSAGGGGGLQDNGHIPLGIPSASAADGGSGGGSGASPTTFRSSGNTPPVSPPQGNNGGYGSGQSETAGAGGGGATSVGQFCSPNTPTTKGGNGGNGAGTAINPSPSYGTPGPSGPLRYYAGGGGGGYGYNSNPAGGSGGGDGGYGGGAAGKNTGNTGNNGTANTGGGGGGVIGSYGPANASGGTGGSGIVIIRYKFQN
jgi:hypothetical protein